MAKLKKPPEVFESEAPEGDPFWIYPGERRPVVVQAKNERHAKHKVSESPEYDGFPVYVFPVDRFAARCVPKGGHSKLEDTEEEKREVEVKKKGKEAYLLVKAVNGRIERVSVYSRKEVALEETSKLAGHLSHENDDLRVFGIPTDVLFLPDVRVDVNEVYSAALVGAPGQKKNGG